MILTTELAYHPTYHKKSLITVSNLCFSMEQVRGIEPPCRPWQGRVLPLNYTCEMAVQTRIELAISSVTGRHVKPLHHWTRFLNLMAEKEGFEPSRQFPDLYP